MPIDSRQYDSVISQIRDDTGFSRLVGNLSNIDDRIRIKAYEMFEDFYYNRPEHIKVVLRGEDDDCIEIYMPSAKKCIEAVNRFLAVEFDYQIDPDADEATSQVMDDALQSLFKRQEVVQKFNQMKRYMLIKGDALLHIRAIPWEKAGRRLRVDELRPEHYFPIEDFATGECIGCHIVDVIRNPRNSSQTKAASDEWIVRRQTYKRAFDDSGTPTGRITSELSLWKVGMWDDRVATPDLDQISVVTPEFELDPLITEIPVYHWANRPPPGSTFGMSELAGVESIINAINQSATDEDLTLITQGLGVYWTDASPPIDENGNEVEWEIGPGAVVQVGVGANFGRVSGVSTLTPFHEHISLLDENMQQALGVPDVAIGMVDVAAVESGIALTLKFGPLIAANTEKMPTITKVADEFLDDLLDWLQVYEGIARNGVDIQSVFGDPMPKNTTQMLADYLSIWVQAPSTLPVEWLYDRLNELFGWDLSDSDFNQALEDAKKIAESAAPPNPIADQMNQFGDQGGQVPPDAFQNNGQTLDFSTM
jgi:hypothetical protein